MNDSSQELAEKYAPVAPRPAGSDEAMVLLVEDDAYSRQIVQRLLEGAGIRVDTAQNGRQALARLLARPHDYDLVLMDIQMPIMDGYEATRSIRRHPELQALPIVALTANATTGDLELTHASGMNAHIEKPINVRELHRILLHFLGDRGDWAAAAAGVALADAPTVEGVDTAALLARIGCDPGMMFQLLDDFAHDHRDVVKQIVSLLERDPSAAEHRVHTLKGVAGNLGITGVHQAATLLDRALQKRRTAEYAHLLKALHSQIAAACRGIQEARPRHRPPPAPAPAATTQIEPRQLEERYAALQQALASRRPQPCKQILKELTGLALPASEQLLFQRLNRAVTGYRFKEALQLLAGRHHE